jgi:hypothetical protein
VRNLKIGIVDIVAAVIVLVVILLPTSSKKIHAFYEGKAAQQSGEIAAAQADLLRAPDDTRALERLVTALVRAGQSDWALRTAGARAEVDHPDRWRVAHMVSMVHFDRFEIQQASEWAEKAYDLCDREKQPKTSCKDHERFRVQLYADRLAAGLASGIDPTIDPEGFERAMQAAQPWITTRPPSKP